MSRQYIAVFALVVAGTSNACELKPFDPIEHGRDATLAVVGYVVGKRRLEFEPRVSGGEGPPSLLADGSRIVQVGVVEVLKGTPLDVMEAPAPCSWRFPALFERVAMIEEADGFRRVFSGEKVEAELRAAIAASTNYVSKPTAEDMLGSSIPLPRSSGLTRR